MLVIVIEKYMWGLIWGEYFQYAKQPVLLPHPRGTVPLLDGDTASLCHTCMFISIVSTVLSAKFRI